MKDTALAILRDAAEEAAKRLARALLDYKLGPYLRFELERLRTILADALRDSEVTHREDI